MNDGAAHPAPRVVVMGITGCGKSEVGQRLAQALQAHFIEGDDYHPAANRLKMRAGVALTDDDRWSWLQQLGQAATAQLPLPGFVLACSALRRAYRSHLRDAVPGLQFVFLDTPRALSVQRVSARAGHFMPASLVDSQLLTLESPVNEVGVVTVPADQPLQTVAMQALQGLALLHGTTSQQPTGKQP